MGVLSRVNTATTADHTCNYSTGQKNADLTMPIILFRCMGWYRPAGTTGGPWRPLSIDQVLSRTYEAHGRIDLCWFSHSAHYRLRNKNGPMMPCLEMATQAVHSKECNSLCRQCPGVCFPRRCCFLSSHDPITENVPRLKTIHCQGAHFEHIFWVLVNQKFFKL